METVHVTIRKGEPIEPVQCMQCCNKYHCPFCRPEVFKPTAESKLLNHIRAHEKRAVQFKDYVIFKCNLTCRSESHFHCPTCGKLMQKRDRFVDHLEKCVTKPPSYYLHIKEEPESYHGSDEEKDHPALGEVSSEKENKPNRLSTCSEAKTNSRREAVISLQTSPGSRLFKTNEVSINTQCFLELFQLCWRCHRECSITIEGHEKLFIVTQDCPSCKYLRQWKSHPTSPEEPAETLHNDRTETGAASYPAVEHNVKDESGKEAGIRLLSSDNEHSLPSFEQMFIEIDGSYLSNAEENGQYIEHWNSGIRNDAMKQENGKKTSLKEQTVEDKVDRSTSQKQDSDLEEEAAASDASMDEVMGYEQVFIEEDGSYLSSADKTKRLRAETVENRSRSEEQDSGDEQEPDLEEEEEATNSDAALDEDLFTALKEDSHLKVVVWCTECGTDALLSCSLHRHKKLFCCAHCGDGDHTKIRNLEKLPVRFEDFGSFQRHAEKEHGAKAFHKLCQECGKFVISDPETGAVKDHKCERNVCPACGKKFLTETGLKTHYTELHEDSDHPCKYCLKVFNTRPLKLEHEQTHPQEKQPYSCPDCPEKFDNVHKRNSHLKSHRGSYKYFCDICEKYFKDIIRLRRHKLLHTREKPYKCQGCERSFNQMENLRSHKCEQPGESFNLSVSLKNNQVQHRHSGDDQMDTEETECSRESGPE